MRSTLANLRRILESDLVPSLKPLAIALALHGDAEGQGIYPSVRTLAAWLGRTRRAVQYGLRDLERLKIIRPRAKGGYGSAHRNPRGGYTTVYLFSFDHLPAHGHRADRPSSVTKTKRVNAASPLGTDKGEHIDTKGRTHVRQKGERAFTRSTLDLLRSTQREKAQPRAVRRSPSSSSSERRLSPITQSALKAYRESRK